MTEGEILAARKPTRIAILLPGEPGPVPRTKVGGVPLWPLDTLRPRCSRGHPMSFVIQVRLADVPGWADDPGLLSFHYCMSCAGDGRMAFGLDDSLNPPTHKGYAIDLFPNAEDLLADGLGEVPSLEELSSEGFPDEGFFPPARVDWLEVAEVMSLEETPEPWGEKPDVDYAVIEELTELQTTPRDTPLHISMTKVGGWPAWDHYPVRPSCPAGHELAFVAQLHYWQFPQAPWAGGGHAFLFACDSSCPSRFGELVIQTT